VLGVGAAALEIRQQRWVRRPDSRRRAGGDPGTPCRGRCLRWIHRRAGWASCRTHIADVLHLARVRGRRPGLMHSDPAPNPGWKVNRRSPPPPTLTTSTVVCVRGAEPSSGAEKSLISSSAMSVSFHQWMNFKVSGRASSTEVHRRLCRPPEPAVAGLLRRSLGAWLHRRRCPGHAQPPGPGRAGVHTSVENP